ncbi:MAG: DnaJ domain-containing protein [Pseudomonadota bacterium]
MALVLLLPLVAGVVLFVGAIAAGRWFVNANPARIAKMIRSGGSVALMLVGALLLMRGQVFLGGTLLMAGLGRLAANRPVGGMGGFGGFGHRSANPRPGQQSTVRTARLEATLDHDTGDMDIEVLAGQFEGQRFSELSVSDVLSVYADCADCSESRLLVEAYLDRRAPEWREDVDMDGDGGARGAGGSVGGGAMTEKDAYEVLGLQPGASEAEIRASHRRLMKQMHPDQGGSTFFAAKLNEAKDVLLRKR